MRLRLVIVGVLIATLPCFAAAHAFAADEPTAAELLERAHRGESITATDTAKTRPMLWSIGVGANRLSPLFEYDSYMGQDQRFGAYVGLGMRTASIGTGAASLVTLHFGPSFRPDPYWRLGIGIEHHHVSASTGSIGIAADEWGPHGWFELGYPRGFAVRTQIGTEGAGITAHWRF